MIIIRCFYEHVGVGNEFIELIILSKFAVSAAVDAIKLLLPIASTWKLMNYDIYADHLQILF